MGADDCDDILVCLIGEQPVRWACPLAEYRHQCLKLNFYTELFPIIYDHKVRCTSRASRKGGVDEGWCQDKGKIYIQVQKCMKMEEKYTRLLHYSTQAPLPVNILIRPAEFEEIISMVIKS